MHHNTYVIYHFGCIFNASFYVWFIQKLKPAASQRVLEIALVITYYGIMTQSLGNARTSIILAVEAMGIDSLIQQSASTPVLGFMVSCLKVIVTWINT